MNRSEIFRNAWISARNFATVKGGTARQYIGDALRKAWQGVVVTIEMLTKLPDAVQIQKLADALVFGFGQFYNNAKKQEAFFLVFSVTEAAEGLAREIAESVIKYNKCSPKQAWHIAKAVQANCGNAARYAEMIYSA
jgi:hypothetical protein